MRKEPELNDARQEFFISQIIGRKIYDSNGRKVDRLKDLVAIWTAGHPQVVGLKIASAQESIPLIQVAEIGPGGIKLKNPWDPQHLRPVNDNEILVNRWLLDKQVVDIRGAKVERVNDIRLQWYHIEGRPRLVLLAVDIGLRGLVRRLGLQVLVPHTHEKLLHWENFKPLTTKTANLELAVPAEYIAGMHPADIAGILQELHPDGQRQILSSLEPDTAGQTLAKVDAGTRGPLMASLSPQEVHPLISAMAPDDAADNLSELPQPMQDKIMGLLEPEKADELAMLMQHQEGTAGSLMTSQFITFHQDSTVRELYRWLQEEQPDFETWNEVFLLDDNQALSGMVPLRTLILAHPETILRDVMEPALRLHPEDVFGKILDFSVKYDLLALPVVDEQNRLLGVITFDDVLTALAVNPRNRRFLPRSSLLAIMQKWAKG